MATYTSQTISNQEIVAATLQHRLHASTQQIQEIELCSYQAKGFSVRHTDLQSVLRAQVMLEVVGHVINLRAPKSLPRADFANP